MKVILWIQKRCTLAGVVERHVVEHGTGFEREIRRYETAARKYQSAILCQWGTLC